MVGPSQQARSYGSIAVRENLGLHDTNTSVQPTVSRKPGLAGIGCMALGPAVSPRLPWGLYSVGDRTDGPVG